MIDNPPGLRNYWTADYLDELSDEAIPDLTADAPASRLNAGAAGCPFDGPLTGAFHRTGLT